MEQFSLVAFATVELTQGGAKTRWSSFWLTLAMVFNALGVLSLVYRLQSAARAGVPTSVGGHPIYIQNS